MAHSQPFIPQSDDTIIETLPASIVALSRDMRADAANSVGAVVTEVDAHVLSAQQRQALVQQALAAYQIAVVEQEPRAYGHTLAILARWPDDVEKPPLIHVLTAAVLQHNHQFSAALEHLDSALRKEPDNAQALLMDAQIRLVTADYGGARQSCEALRPLVPYAIALNCEAQLDGLTGHAQRGLSDVSAALRESRGINAGDHVELLITAATIAHRLGFAEEAEGYYKSALSQNSDSGYTLVHYLGLLLENDRAEDALLLLNSRSADSMTTELRILYAEALLAVGAPEATALIEELREVFDIAFQRGEALPYKEHARFALNLLRTPEDALVSAEQNWVLQKEPSDTLLLAQAAAANSNASLLADIATWTAEVGTEDVRLTAILAESAGNEGSGESSQ